MGMTAAGMAMRTVFQKKSLNGRPLTLFSSTPE